MKRSLKSATITKLVNSMLIPSRETFYIKNGNKDDIIPGITEDINQIYCIFYKDVWLGTFYMERDENNRFVQNDRITLDINDITAIYDTYKVICTLSEYTLEQLISTTIKQ